MTRSSSRLLACALAMLAWIAAGTPAAAQSAGRLTLEPLEFVAFDGSVIEAEAGTFTVLENRRDPASRVISIALLRLPSTSATPGPPIFFLAGGPGGSGIEAMSRSIFLLARELMRFGDIIALDQRGTGASSPNLSCASRDSLKIPFDEPFDAATVLEQLLKKSERCADAKRARGVDLDGYNTEQSADDIDELRAALGAEQMILWGESYGTHLAMATIRRHGDRVAKAILHGAEGPNHTIKLPRNGDKTLKALAREIRRDAEAGAALPDPVATIRRLIASLDDHPQTVRTVDPARGNPADVTFGGQDLALLLAAAIGDDAFFRALPRLLAGAERGDYDLLARLVASVREPIPLQAMTFAMDCASGATRKRTRKADRQARKSILGSLMNYPFPDVCPAWGVTDLGDGFRSPLRSGVRTLFISGTLDGRTPVKNATEIRRGLRDSELLVLEGVSHDGLLTADARVVAVIEDFLSDRPLGTHRISFLPLSFDPLD